MELTPTLILVLLYSQMNWYIRSTLPLVIFHLGPVSLKTQTYYLLETGPSVGKGNSLEVHKDNSDDPIENYILTELSKSMLRMYRGLPEDKKKKLLDRVKTSADNDYILPLLIRMCVVITINV